MKKEKRRFPLWAKVLTGIFLLLLIFLVMVSIFINSKLNKINKAEEQTALNPENEYFETSETFAESLETVYSDEIYWDSDSDIVSQSDVINIMLIGQDRRPGESRARSDSMMIVSLNKNAKKISLVSLMRDLYVQIPGYSDNRINAAYAFGGMQLLDETVAKNFAIEIDGNIEVDFDGFQSVIDIIGGVDIELYQAEADHLNKQNSSWKLKSGNNHLDGVQALAYSRIRYVGNQDFERTQRQRNVLEAVFDKMKDISVSQMLDFCDEIFPLLTTDLSNTDIVALGMDVLNMNIDSLETYRIPVDGCYDAVSLYQGGVRMDVLVPDLDANRKFLYEYIYDTEPQQESGL